MDGALNKIAANYSEGRNYSAGGSRESGWRATLARRFARIFQPLGVFLELEHSLVKLPAVLLVFFAGAPCAM